MKERLLIINKSLRVFKFSRRLAQVTSYFKHLHRVLFVFQIYTILFHQTNRDLIFLRKRQLLKIIKKRCGYNYMYLLIFETRAFFGGKVCSCARRSLEEKQVTIILQIRVNKYYVLFQF